MKEKPTLLAILGGVVVAIILAIVIIYQQSQEGAWCYVNEFGVLEDCYLTKAECTQNPFRVGECVKKQ